MIERLATRDVFPDWCDGSHAGTKFLRINGGKAYLSTAEERETIYVFSGVTPNTIEEAIHMIDDLP
jgi:hypothetical protein